MNESDFLYYESHITIEPVFDERREQAKVIAKKHGFTLADLLMQKSRVTTPERSDKDTFMTGIQKDSGDPLAANMLRLCVELKAAGFKVWRYKIEGILIDSRKNDEFGLLC